MIRSFVAYGQWANRLLFTGLAGVTPDVLIAPQPGVFGSILGTAHHAMAMAEVWQAHLVGAAHGYTNRIPAADLCLPDIAARTAAVDAWMAGYVADLSAAALAERVAFRFIDGGAGVMTRGEILLHIVNHATYHRGHIGLMLNAAGVALPASDMPVFLGKA